MGQLSRLRTELPESAEPLVPRNWGELNTMTIAFGQGLNVAPLQAMMAVGALANGGFLITPTFLKRSEEDAKKNAPRVIKPETSESMRYLMRLNAEIGTAKIADIQGYFVGGKTGTADKIIHGHYSNDRVFTTFMAILPADKPKYLYLTLLDEPQGVPETAGYRTAAWNAGPVTGKIIERTGPLLGSAAAPRYAGATVSAPGQAWLCGGQSAGEGRRGALMRLAELFPQADIPAAFAGPRGQGPQRRQPRGDGGHGVFRGAGNKNRRPCLCAASGPARGHRDRRRARSGEPDRGRPLLSRPTDVRRALAQASARLYPRQPETIVAVTGTSGKTSVADFVRQIWAALGANAASLGTLGVVAPSGLVAGSLTTPDPVSLHKTLDGLARSGVTHLALEASSHGIVQRRLDGVRLTAAAFTNLSRDHLDYHADARRISRRQTAAVRAAARAWPGRYRRCRQRCRGKSHRGV